MHGAAFKLITLPPTLLSIRSYNEIDRGILERMMMSLWKPATTPLNYRCSFPRYGITASGPSDESPTAVARTGSAAHTHTASPGGPHEVAGAVSQFEAASQL